MTVFIIILLIATGTLGARYWSKKQFRKGLLTTQLSEHQRAIVATEVPLTRKLPSEFRMNLEGKINKFLNQVEFIGCNGLIVNEQMQLSISAQACLLIVNSDTWYEHLRTILIYPGAFKSRHAAQNGFVVTEQETVRTGESWSRGPVVLSWAHSRQGAINYRDGHNVVIHEFAHQIDDLSGHTDGVPILTDNQSFADWQRTFVAAFENHIESVKAGHQTILDPYGAEGPEEFFAVAVEVFFERPLHLKNEEPAIYEQLAKLFRLEPAAWK